MPAMTATPMTTLRKDRELTVPEVARRLKRHPATVREYIHNGVLPAHRVGASKRSGFRIYESDLALAVQPVMPARPTHDETPAGECLESIAQRLVSTWPRLSPERKAELGRLLAVS